MSKRSWRVLLADILERINKIEKYVEGITYEQFIQDDKMKDAVVRNPEIIGEAANHLPKNIWQKFSDVPGLRLSDCMGDSKEGYTLNKKGNRINIASHARGD
jgi:uncharacterized protein with HEPN domain